ncbi:MAG TPA: hypothetical protein VKG43_10715 [Acidimicrobiales bacterium]|nr:hypothetical protein [Acidimicrobiales bacterium]
MNMHTRQVAAEDGASYRVRERAPWSPVQLVALVVGLVLVVIGGVALARTGVNFDNVALTHNQAAGLHYTCLSALIQVVVGVLIMVCGAWPDTARGAMWFFGVVLVAWGLIVAIDSTAFANMWGYTAADGVFYVICGIILIVAAAASPVFFSRRRVVSHQSTGYDAASAAPDPATPGATVPPPPPVTAMPPSPARRV